MTLTIRKYFISCLVKDPLSEGAKKKAFFQTLIVNSSYLFCHSLDAWVYLHYYCHYLRGKSLISSLVGSQQLEKSNLNAMYNNKLLKDISKSTYVGCKVWKSPWTIVAPF